MKKAIAIISILAIAMAATFAATAQTATVNLGTTINAILDAGVTKTSNGTTFPTTGIIGTESQTLSTTSATYYFVVKSNTALAATTIAANVMKHTANNEYIKYEVAVGSSKSTATATAGTAIQLKAADTTRGLHVWEQAFTVQAVDTDITPDNVYGINDAPAGTYAGSITITYQAN